MNKNKNPRLIQKIINNNKAYKNVLLPFGNHVEHENFSMWKKFVEIKRWGMLNFM
jgi:hypothetical protein